MKNIILLILILLLITGCSDSNSVTAPMEQLIKGLEKVEGSAITILNKSIFNNRENLIFYKPVGINESKGYLPEQLTKNYFQLNNNLFPFEVEKSNVIISTSNDKKTGERRHQLQFHYYPKLDNDQNKAHWEAFSIFMSELDVNCYFDRDDKDYVRRGHNVRKRCFGESSVLIHTIYNPDELIHPVTHFPFYKEQDNKIYGMSRLLSNKISIHHNGFYYVIGFTDNCKLTPEKAEEIAIKFVTGR